MAEKHRDLNFIEDVFPAELDEVNKRRQRLDFKTEALEGPPTTNQDLVGLAISGGGIRSATFSLGVIQGLVKQGFFRTIDYLSTVSGGGYTGSCISSLMNSLSEDSAAKAFPLSGKEGQGEPPALVHLRNSSNYLSPGGLLDKLRLSNLLLRGILLNLFLFLPYIILAVFLTELAYEKGPHWDDLSILVLPLLAAFLLLTIAFPFAIRLLRGVFNWSRRNVYERWLTIPLLAAIVVLVAIPILRLTRFAIEHNWSQAIDWINRLEATEYWKAFAILGLITLLFAFAGKASENVARLRGKLVLGLIGLLGPVIIFSIYLGFVLWQIDSPFLPTASAKFLNELAECEEPCFYFKNEAIKGLEKVNPDSLEQYFQQVDQLITTPALAADLVEKFEGRNITIEQNARVRCLIKSCEEEVSDWRQDSSKWVINNSEDLSKTCLADSSPHQIPGATDCYYISRASLHNLRIDGASLTLFSRKEDFIFLGLFMGLLLFNWFFLDVNVTAPHGFYRDRLSKAYLFQTDDEGQIIPNDEQKLSELNKQDTTAPYHLINVALNLQGSKDPNLRGRSSDFFIFSRHFVGSDRTGFAHTRVMEMYDRHLNLGTAMAISGAAAAPNMGSIKNKSLVFIMAFLNIRLGYWLPNPRYIRTPSWYKRLNLKGARPRFVWKEALGKLDAQGSHVNLSDGGHIENLAVYELLKRRCKLIIAIDGEADPNMAFGGLVKLERYARIDMGIDLDIDLDALRTDDNGYSKQHWTVGQIHYGNGETGYLLYIKLSVTGDEPEYIRAYRSTHTSFPHQSTADQFFSEEQFEAYRALGEHIANSLALGEEGNAELLQLLKRGNQVENTLA